MKQPIELEAKASCAAPASVVYDLLADPASHLVWAGERQGSSSRLLTMDAPRAPIGVGDEFSTTGADPMGGFADRSVVTEATHPSAFEFVTEATLTTKKGATSVWTNVHRYEIDAVPLGCHIRYTLRVERVTSLPGLLAIFNWPLLRSLALRASAALPRKGLANLAAMAEERSTV